MKKTRYKRKERFVGISEQEAEAVRKWFGLMGRKSGVARKGVSLEQYSRMGKLGCKSRWGREKFVADKLLEVLGTGQGFSRKELMLYMQGEGMACCPSHLSRQLVRIKAVKGPDRLYRLAQK